MSANTLDKIIEIVCELSGHDHADLSVDRPFLSLGFDSLSITQLAAALQKEFCVKLTFRQLIDKMETIRAVAAHIDASRPAPTVAPVAPKADVRTVDTTTLARSVPSTAARVSLHPTAASNNQNGMLSTFAQQLELMRMQIALLSGQQMTNATDASASLVATAPEHPVTMPAADGPASEPERPVLPKGFGPQTGAPTSTMNLRQQRHVASLIAQLNSRTAKSKAAAQEFRQYHADPRTAAGFDRRWKDLVYPIVVERSEGAYLWDVDGNRYIDLLNGFGPNFFGHRAPFITEAVRKQLETGFEIGPQTPNAGAAAALFCELTGQERVGWVNTGSEAVQAAIRVARTVTQRDKIVVFAGAYHGNFDEVLVRRSQRSDRSIPLAPGIPDASVGNVIVLPYGEDASLEVIRSRADEIAAVLVEPIQSRRPEFLPKEFILSLRQLTEAAEIVLVFDEVITGFRTGCGGSQDFYGIRADLATYGKVLGGGMPIGAVAGRAKFMDTFDGGHWSYDDESIPTAGVTFFAGTFVRHPLAIAAVHASLLFLKAAGPKLQEMVGARAGRLARGLNKLFDAYDAPFFLAQTGSQMFIRTIRDDPHATLFFYHLRLRGVHALDGFPTYMTAAHTDEDVDVVIEAARQSLEAMKADQVLQSPQNHEPLQYRQPLSTTQLALWAATQTDPGLSSAFHESDRFEFRGNIDTTRLLHAVNSALAAHDGLRVRISDDGSDCSFDAPAAVCRFCDLSDVPADYAHAQIEKHVDQDIGEAYDIAAGLLVRASLFRLSSSYHVLYLFGHHLALDGYSVEAIFDDITNIYHHTDVLPRPDYATALSKFGSTRRDDTEFVVRRLHSTVKARGHDSTSVMDYSASTVSCGVDGAKPDRIRDAAKVVGVTPATLMLAMCSIALAEQIGRPHLVIGIPVAGQLAADAPVVGFMAHLVPITVDVSAFDSFEALCRYLQAEVRDAALHYRFDPFQLTRALSVVGGMPAIVDAVFNYRPAFVGQGWGDVVVSASELPRRHLAYAHFVNVSASADGIVVDWEYQTQGASAVEVERSVRKLTDGIAQCVSPEGFAIQRGTYASANALDKASADRPTRLVATQTAEESVLLRLASHAQKQRDAVAVIHDGSAQTYGQLSARVGEIASHLYSHGVVPGNVVGVLLPRDADLIATLLAIWSVGAAFLPLDPEHPIARTSAILADSGAGHIVVTEMTQAIASGDVVRIRIDEKAGEFDEPKIFNPAPDDLAYLIYTSGSTGAPKGVKIRHRAVWNFLAGVGDRVAGDKPVNVLALTTIAFDIAMLELFLPLWSGGTCIVAEATDAADGDRLQSLLRTHHPHLMQATPVTWRLLLDSGWEGAAQLVALCGGEAMPAPLAEELLGRVRELWNMYGPTEATVWCSAGKIVSAENIHIGKPLAGMRMICVAENGDEVEPGVPGEIWIAGDGVSVGYHDRPELTAARFVQRHADEKLYYRTGDEGFVDIEGNWHVRGRLDDQIKLRGHRIEPAEVESALLAIPEVADVAVAMADGDVLVAFAVFRPGPVPTTSELRRALRNVLPAYMIPQQFMELSAIPRLPNLKLDRAAIRKLAQPSTLNRKVIPRTDIECAIADVWREFLGVDDVSITDNFYELGGHSLLAVQMVARLRKVARLGVAPRAVIFESLEQLAAGAQRL